MGVVVPPRASVVVVGGGVIGASVAYHLADIGWSDVVVLERGAFTGGTTWHAAGLVGQLRSSSNLTRLVRYSTELYERLEGESERATGWRRTGSISVARTPERMVQLQRSAEAARLQGVECTVLDPREVRALWPLARTGDLTGAIHLPGDGRVNPVDLTASLLHAARARGVEAFERIAVTKVDTTGGKVRAVETTEGSLGCDVVVDCAGMWSQELVVDCTAVVPLHAAEHFYAVTEPIDGVHPDLPVLRDPDGRVYFKEEVGGLVVGGFEVRAKPWGTGGLPAEFEFTLLPEDWEHFSVLMEGAIERVPALANAGVKILYNGPESFTPDGHFLLGAVPGVSGLFVAAGFNSMGIASAGGAGWALAHWIAHGRAPFDLWPVDVRRFSAAHANSAYLRDRVVESVGLHYAMAWPDRELETARGLRRSPVHHVLDGSGASFGTADGWERANLFDPAGQWTCGAHGWGAPRWLGGVGGEVHAARRAAALIDDSGRAKLLVHGDGAASALGRLCAGDVDVEPGHAVRTAALDDDGRYLGSFDVVRMASDEYLVLSGAGEATKDLGLVRAACKAGTGAGVVDVSAAYGLFVLVGPRAAALLGSLSGAVRDVDRLPRGAARRVEVGYATAVTFHTCLGTLDVWELLVPSDQAVNAYRSLLDAGADVDLAQAGWYAYDSLRLDAAYRRWGRELTSDRTPLEATLAGEPSLLDSRHDFRGRDALEAQARAGLRRRLVVLEVEDPSAMAWGGEVILRDGDPVGSTTTAGYSHLAKRAVALGYVETGVDPHGEDDDEDADGWLRTGRYGIAVGGATLPCTVARSTVCDLASGADPGPASTTALAD